MRTMTAVAVMLVVFGIGSTVVLGAVPFASGTLTVRTTMDVGTDMGSSGDVDSYNCRSYGGNNYITNKYGFARYAVGSSTVDKYYSNGSNQMRSAMPFPGSSPDYVLGGTGSSVGPFTRLDYANLDNATTSTLAGVAPHAFDWIDNDTLIFCDYKAKGRLYLGDVVANPFSVSINTTWNANGYLEEVDTHASSIRSIRKGDTYSGYAYYGASGVDVGANFCAINLATGATTILGTLGTTGDPLTGSRLWTVQEAGGYLYLHTSSNGIYVYNMTDAETLGTLVTHHTAAQLATLLGTTNALLGFDAVDGGEMLLLSVDNDGLAFELVPEPATLTLIALGGLGLLKRRRK